MTHEQQQKLNPRTASSGQSIWQDIPENIFREHLVTLEERTNAVPVRSQTFPFLPCTKCSSAEAHLLSVEAEQRLADDFAYIAAVGEGAQSVSAVCVEEYSAPASLCIRFAAVDTIEERVQHAFWEVGNLLKRVAVDQECYNIEEKVQALLILIIEQHLQKLFGRLRSKKWRKPRYLSRTHKKPLWSDFETIVHRVQFVYTKKKDPKRSECEEQLQWLAATIQAFEEIPHGSSAEFMCMLKIVRSSYSLCQNTVVKDFAARLDAVESPTPQVAAATKALRQVEKIGSYQRIAQDLIACARQYSILFRDLSFEFLPVYRGVATGIGYESWARTMHVHAEVQLVLYYDMLSVSESRNPDERFVSFKRPRVIGTSKYLCYLCYLFLKYHGEFIPVNTHGKLYDQWTIADLAEFDDSIRQKYRKVIKDINADVVLMSNQIGPRNGKRDPWRYEPMTSRQNLLNPAVPEPCDLLQTLDGINALVEANGEQIE